MLYQDDAKMVADLLKNEWELEFSEVPNIYYEPTQMARNNNPSSIQVTAMGPNMSRVGINYEAMKRTHRISLDIQTPVNRQTHFNVCNEVWRILYKYRRAGKSRLGGWDYIEIPSFVPRQGYTSYFHDVCDITLVSEVTIIEVPGFGDEACDCRNETI